MKKIFTKTRLILLSGVLLAFTARSQSTFQKVYPTTYDKTSREILETPDGGYLIAGMTNKAVLNDNDMYVMKTDASGEFVWGKTYGGAKTDYAYSMIETFDGNYFVLGFSQSFGGGDYDVYLVKIDPVGNLLWQKTYISWGNEEGREIIKTLDGNFMIVGTTNSNRPSQDAFLLKINPEGNVLWLKHYGGSGRDFGNSVKQCSDGGFILTGQTYSFGQNGDVFLVRTNFIGDTLWTKHYGGALTDEGVSVVIDADGFAVAVRDSSNGGDVNVGVIKTDPSGNVIWSKLFGGSEKDTPKRMNVTSDGGYIVGAISRSFGFIYPDMWLIKLNAQGDSTWSRHYGGPNHDHCHDVKQSADGGYLAVGHSRSYAPAQQIMFVKVSSSGIVSLQEEGNTFNKLEIFPNPVEDGCLNIQGFQEGILQVQISNPLGDIIVSETYTDLYSDQPAIIKLPNKSAGMYFVTLRSGNKVRTEKIIIR
jgi:hypothetical protein